MAVNVNAAASAYGKALQQLGKGGLDGGDKVGAGQAEGGSFAKMLERAAEGAVDVGRQNETVSLQSVTKDAEITDIVTAVANAEVTLQTVVAVRDRVVAAYQEILRMPI